jgi:hypothetical protein
MENHKKFTGLLCILLGFFLLGCGNQEKSVTFVSLINEMADREAITNFPDYKLKQVSSYDRTQTSPENQDTWFNNKDYGHFIRKESVQGRTEYVIMEEDGPGCIVRWWIPLAFNYSDRIVRIYLDGNPTPAIEENYHDFLSGQSFAKEPYAFISSDEKDSTYQVGVPVGHPKQMGADLYLPIPFSKSCKITLDGDPFYYVINYRMYEPQVSVQSFSKEIFDDAEKQLEETANLLVSQEDNTPNLKKDVVISSKDRISMDLDPGENAIQSIVLEIDPGLPKEALRGLVLKMKFDGRETVWCPISEFFGGGVYVRSVWNRNMYVSEDGIMKAHWVMPYRESGSIEVINHWSEPVSIDLGVLVRPYRWTDESMYFHANWHEEAPIKTNTPVDWNYVFVEGKGVYAGDVLTVHSFSKGWWGEGDEKIYVDGEEFPSHLGTGLEDYYGYAWGMAHKFSSPFISVPLRDARGKADWRGYTTVSRMRLLDAIPFRNSLKVDVEAWVHDSTVSFAAATFWYGSLDATCNRTSEEDAVTRELPDFYGQKPEETPGKNHPDPASKGLIQPGGNGSVKQAGNHLDLLGWHDPAISKPLDADRDNRYGSAGYYLLAVRRLNVNTIQFHTDSISNPPEFIASMNVAGKELWASQNTWFDHPQLNDNMLITGSVGLSCNASEEEAIVLVVNNEVPDAFRLGVMLDNLAGYLEPDLFINISTTSNGDSGNIPLARSNRYPDWYFFDIQDLTKGDKITIRCVENGNQFLPIGALVFDVIQ